MCGIVRMYVTDDEELSLLKSDLRLFFTKDQNTLDQYYKIRERCYRQVKNGPKDFDGHQDVYDISGDILIVTYKDVVVGGARIFDNYQTKKLRLPLETDEFILHEQLPHLKLDNSSYCEFGRLALLKSFRHSKILDTIVENLVTYSIARGYRYLFFMSPLVQARCYKQALSRLQVNGEFRIYRDIKINGKTPEECGVLDMYLSSLKFPKKWNGVRERGYHHAKL